MIPINDLNLGHNDAENYKRPNEMKLFNQLFLETDALNKLCDDSIYYLIGEKGSGKTAYAVYFSNNSFNGYSGKLTFLRQTPIDKFVTLKQKNQLDFSNYNDIWEVIIYFLISQQIIDKEGNNFISRFIKFKNLQESMNEFFKNALRPEILLGMTIIENSEISSELSAKHAQIGANLKAGKSEISESKNYRYQLNLSNIKRQFEDALRSISLTKHYVLFLDGIDTRPPTLTIEDYIKCIQGLANASWAVNNDFFATLENEKGSLKVVLLVRPDIFDKFGLQNQNNKLRDNSVILNWETPHLEYRSSNIFKIADNLLKSQQIEKLSIGESWDYYFPFTYIYPRKTGNKQIHFPSFVGFLNHSLARPRDIIAMLKLMKDIHVRKNRGNIFSGEDFIDAEFQRKLSEYYLSEIKDQLGFYYSENDYKIFLKFFDFLRGKIYFNYLEFSLAFGELIEYIYDNGDKMPLFCADHDKFLQFLYELNVIGFNEKRGGKTFWHWCYRHRTYATLFPQVNTHSEYLIHEGMRKVINIGKQID
jgi:hypothetical protein